MSSLWSQSSYIVQADSGDSHGEHEKEEADDIQERDLEDARKKNCSCMCVLPEEAGQSNRTF